MFGDRLEIGLSSKLSIREERLSSSPDACRLLYISDIHLRQRRSDVLKQQVLESAQMSDADVILLGGDLVDTRSELPSLTELVRQLQQFAPVLAIAGNHDVSVGLHQVKEAVVRGGGQWIHEHLLRFRHRSRNICICGPELSHGTQQDGFRHRRAPTSANRSVNEKRSIRVLCAHNPRIWKKSRAAGYDLVLAGHLHGCQVVAFEFRDRLFPGAAFYPCCFLSRQFGSTRLVVSRGVSDLVPIRWRCPREVVLCYV